MLATLTLIGLLVGPPPEAVDVLAEIDHGLEVALRDPDAAIEILGAALERMPEHAASLADDRDALSKRDRAMLALAWCLLGRGNREAAVLVIDEALRSAQGRTLPVEEFGPELEALQRERVELLRAQGSARLDVRCEVACRVLLDERALDSFPTQLHLGSYRLWIEDRGGELEPLRTIVTLDHRGQIATVSFGPEPEPEPPPPPIEVPVVPERVEAQPRDRMLPRWVEITLMGVGAAVAIGGGVALSYQGKCPGGFDPMANPEACPRLYDAIPVGASLLALGLGSVATFTVLVTVDEVRGARRGQSGRQVGLGMTLRF